MNQETHKVCAYVMTVDSGLAPNPFHGTCTLAVCTPNHVRANLDSGDWIVGVAGVELCKRLVPPRDPLRLIYAMKVDKRMTLNDYYKSIDYKSKIPGRYGSGLGMCGDNFYKLVDGKLIHTGESIDHDSPKIMAQDSHGDRVFVGKTFHYFGSMAPKIPADNGWGSKLVNQLTKRSVGVTYILGGKCKDPWDRRDLDEFTKFCDSNHIDQLPTPIDFGNWRSEPEGSAACTTFR